MQTASADLRQTSATHVLAAMAEAWGYPREIREDECATGTWFVSALGILWLVPLVPPKGFVAPAGLELDGVLSIHGIGQPGRWQAALSADTARLIEAVGRGLGARKLVALNGPPSMRAVARYLRRYGWARDEWGAYKVLEGER